MFFKDPSVSGSMAMCFGDRRPRYPRAPSGGTNRVAAASDFPQPVNRMLLAPFQEVLAALKAVEETLANAEAEALPTASLRRRCRLLQNARHKLLEVDQDLSAAVDNVDDPA